MYQAVEEHEPLPARSVASLGAGLAEGLSVIHGHELVHRDLKPANVILATDGPRVIDFGIARALDTTSHTRTNTVLGTAGFMAPEQARAENVSPATDVFALGCVLTYAATGRSPFGTGRADAVAYRVVHEKPNLAGVPVSLAPLITGCLAKKPQRQPTLDRVLRQLTALAGPDTDGHWLPTSITEVIHHLTTAAHTLPPTLYDPDTHQPDSTKKKKAKKKPKRTPPEQASPKKTPPKSPEPPPKKDPDPQAGHEQDRLGELREDHRFPIEIHERRQQLLVLCRYRRGDRRRAVRLPPGLLPLGEPVAEQRDGPGRGGGLHHLHQRPAGGGSLHSGSRQLHRRRRAVAC